MPDMDAIALADQAVLIGLVTPGQAREAVGDAEDGSLEAMARAFLRKGLLTSWQIERLQKADPTGFFFGGCKVLFHLAEGTFARVYRGERQESLSPVAIKVLRNRFAQDPFAVKRFHQEAESGMKLVHPNIVRILTYGEEDKRQYMIMEYVEGSNLRDFLRIRGRLSEKHALPLMIGLAHGLRHSIENGVTHRDIKGTNILVSTSGDAKLVDFGLAGIESDEKKSSMQSLRTVDYSALERGCGSEKGDPRSDIYFLGQVYYQMLTGKVAMLEAESKDMLVKMLKRSFSSIKPLSESPYAPSEELCRIVEKMMKVDLKARYQTIGHVADDLERHAADLLKGKKKKVQKAADDVENMSMEELFMSRHSYIDASDEATAAPAAVAEFASEPEEEMPETLGAADDDDEAPIGIAAGETRAIVRRNVLCVESRSDVQDVFRKTLSKMGYRVILVADPERAAERYSEATPDAVVFDVDGLGPEAIDSFISMHDTAHHDGHPLVALVLLGPRQLALKDRLPTGDHLIVLSKPLKMKQIQDALVQLVPVR